MIHHTYLLDSTNSVGNIMLVHKLLHWCLLCIGAEKGKDHALHLQLHGPPTALVHLYDSYLVQKKVKWNVEKADAWKQSEYNNGMKMNIYIRCCRHGQTAIRGN